MAAASVAVVGEEVCLGPFVSTFGQCSEGIDEVTTWATRVCCIHSSPDVAGHKDRPTALPSSLVSEVALAPPPVSPHLPMWPPTRPVWPPSRSVFRGRGAGEARLSTGVRSGTGLQRRWGSRDDQHVRSRHGFGCSQRSGHPQIGSCGGRLTLWRGAQLAIDTTLVSPLRRDGTARARAANHDGAALEDARRRKEATYPELSGEGGRARLVVLAAEVGGGRWSVETAQFLTALAKARA